MRKKPKQKSNLNSGIPKGKREPVFPSNYNSFLRASARLVKNTQRDSVASLGWSKKKLRKIGNTRKLRFTRRHIFATPQVELVINRFLDEGKRQQAQLIEQLWQGDKKQKINAMYVLAVGEEEQAIPVIRHFLSHQDTELRYHAVCSLGCFEPKKVMAMMVTSAKDKNGQVKKAALDWLKSLKKK